MPTRTQILFLGQSQLLPLCLSDIRQLLENCVSPYTWDELCRAAITKYHKVCGSEQQVSPLIELNSYKSSLRLHSSKRKSKKGEMGVVVVRAVERQLNQNCTIQSGWKV